MHLLRQFVVSLCLAFLFVLVDVQAGTPDEWKSRTIYQLLTDRFAVGGSNSKQNCWNLSNYCGGNFQGIIDRLDYIQGMGFDAIWISPIPENYQGGYHGYWMTNLESINSNFGTSAQLSDLIEACHKRGIWVMLDVVGNHVGPVGTDYSQINPFNQAQYYHTCNGCPSNCDISDWNNQNQVENCRLSSLPDLDQSNSFVNSTLLNWISGVMHTYGFDGIRIDTVPEVPKNFWAEYVAYSGAYAVGEVYNGDPNYVSGYQEPKGPLPGVLSYPMYFTLRDVFAYGKTMSEIESQMANYHSMFGDIGLLGTFIDNHDQPRFLSQNTDSWMYKNAIAYTLMAQGIPIIYYGTEQGFNGGNDPKNREVLWTSSYTTDTDLYKFIQTIVNFRKENQIWKYDQVQRYSTYNFYAFTRGNFFVALTNVGSNGNTVQYTITYHPYSNGQKLCDLFYPTDCITVANNQFTITLLHGECKIFYPVSSEDVIIA